MIVPDMMITPDCCLYFRTPRDLVTTATGGSLLATEDRCRPRKDRLSAKEDYYRYNYDRDDDYEPRYHPDQRQERRYPPHHRGLNNRQQGNNRSPPDNRRHEQPRMDHRRLPPHTKLWDDHRRAQRYNAPPREDPPRQSQSAPLEQGESHKPVSVTCFYCNQPGHYATQCPTNDRGKAHAMNIITGEVQQVTT